MIILVVILRIRSYLIASFIRIRSHTTDRNEFFDAQIWCTPSIYCIHTYRLSRNSKFARASRTRNGRAKATWWTFFFFPIRTPHMKHRIDTIINRTNNTVTFLLTDVKMYNAYGTVLYCKGVQRRQTRICMPNTKPFVFPVQRVVFVRAGATESSSHTSLPLCCVK